MIAFALWAHRSIATTNAATLFSGMAVIGLTTFLPMYVQAVMGRSPLEAGFMLTAMVLGWPISATLGRAQLRPVWIEADPDRRRCPAAAGGDRVRGAVADDVAPGGGTAGSLVMGFGMGFLSTAAIVLIQDSVGWAERGAATASNLFARNLGSTLGATVLGAVLNASLARGHSGSLQQVQQLLSQTRLRAGRRGESRRAGARAAPDLLGRAADFAAATLAISLLVPVGEQSS